MNAPRTHTAVIDGIARSLAGGVDRRTLLKGGAAIGGLAFAGVSARQGHAAGGIIGQWPLDDGQGDVADDIAGHHLHGHLGAANIYGLNDPNANKPVWVAEEGATFLRLANFGFVEVRGCHELEPAAVTAEAWVRAKEPPGRFAYVLAKGAYSCTAASFALTTGPISAPLSEARPPEAGLTFYVYGAGRTGGTLVYPSAHASAEAVWDGEWHHVAGTFARGRLRLFLDGKEVGRPTAGPAAIAYDLPDNDRFYIGAYRSPGSCLQGFMGDIHGVTLWDRALTSAEIATRAT